MSQNTVLYNIHGELESVIMATSQDNVNFVMAA